MAPLRFVVAAAPASAVEATIADRVATAPSAMSFEYEVVVMRAALRSTLTAHSSSSTFRHVKKRLDMLLVERGLAESRSQAQALILAGLVHGHDKPGDQVEETAELELERPPRFVSRGGEKLANALERLGVDPSGKDALDVGASTGGFTDCLLQAGASRVIALDVGYGQLHPRLRDDTRVVVLERVNARVLDALPFAPELITCDVSFISVLTALPPALRLAKRGWEALVLVKPQFEAGPAQAPKGVVRDPDVHRTVLHRVAEAVPGLGAQLVGVVDSGLPGPKGNREFFIHLIDSEEPAQRDDVDRWIDDAVVTPAASGH
jgi:23S rRNA (cytidine1920-2'-O)/16S rRNA (cytidine1409-2'-O)-methyltransferase